MGISELIVAATFFSVFAALAIVRRQIERGQQTYSLRSLTAFNALRRQVGMALESGRPPLLALGRGALHTTAGPVSVAGLQVLHELAEGTGRGQLTPQVMIGAATLLPVAQDDLNRVADESVERHENINSVQFIADESFPFTYAAGTSSHIEREAPVASIAVGHFGSEIALIGEAASRNGIEQIMGSDDPTAIAISVATTENSLWGEELFAAGAYLRQAPWDLAAIRIQDLLRWFLIAALLVATIVHLLGIS